MLHMGDDVFFRVAGTQLCIQLLEVLEEGSNFEKVKNWTKVNCTSEEPEGKRTTKPPYVI